MTRIKKTRKKKKKEKKKKKMMIIVLSVLYACVLYLCICTCSAQMSMFHIERRSRNTLIIIIIIIVITLKPLLSPPPPSPPPPPLHHRHHSNPPITTTITITIMLPNRHPGRVCVSRNGQLKATYTILIDGSQVAAAATRNATNVEDYLLNSLGNSVIPAYNQLTIFGDPVEPGFRLGAGFVDNRKWTTRNTCE